MPAKGSKTSDAAFRSAVRQISRAISHGGVRDVHYLRRLAETACQIHGCRGMVGEVFAAARAENANIRLRIVS
jgi:hypothetical protein